LRAVSRQSRAMVSQDDPLRSAGAWRWRVLFPLCGTGQRNVILMRFALQHRTGVLRGSWVVSGASRRRGGGAARVGRMSRARARFGGRGARGTRGTGRADPCAQRGDILDRLPPAARAVIVARSPRLGHRVLTAPARSRIPVAVRVRRGSRRDPVSVQGSTFVINICARRVGARSAGRSPAELAAWAGPEVVAGGRSDARATLAGSRWAVARGKRARAARQATRVGRGVGRSRRLRSTRKEGTDHGLLERGASRGAAPARVPAP
jgi:hypothetical protein